MRLERLAISDVLLLSPKVFRDARGYFMETYRADLLAEAVGSNDFVQDNQSLSAEVGTVRGLHFQLPPKAQGKLIRCLAGAIFDVVVDLRRGSPSFGRHVTVELSADNAQQLWIPPGFAHGFCTLEPNAVIAYKVTDYYSPEHDRGLRWNDPALGIRWPVDEDKAILSAKDTVQPLLADLPAAFDYAG